MRKILVSEFLTLDGVFEDPGGSKGTKHGGWKFQFWNDPEIMREANKLGLPIVRILLTHDHIDHVGSLDALHIALPDAPVAISERDARLLSGDMSLDPTEPQGKQPGG